MWRAPAALKRQKNGLGSGTDLDQPPLPGERALNDTIEIVEHRLPAEDFADPIGFGHKSRRVSWPARAQAHGEIAA